MNNIRVAAAALNQIPLDWEGNYNRIIEVINLAVDEEVSLLCLPELCITGYGCEDAFFAKEVHNKAVGYLDKIINYLIKIDYEKGYDITISVGLPYFLDGALYNVAALINRSGCLGLVPKQNLANDGVHYESRWFKPGPINSTQELKFGDNSVYFGDLIFNFEGIRVGFEICEDLWVANRPGSSLASKAVDIILNPSASHFAFGKHETRERLVVESSRAYKCTYVYSNLLGNESGRVIFEGDNMIASAGKLIASSPRLSFKDVILTTAVIDTDHTKTLQVMNGSFHPILADKSKETYVVIECDELKTIRNGYSETDNALRAEKLTKFDEFIFAESLGLFDYMRKSYSQGYCLSLSGGCDSAVCAILVKFMHDRGIKQLGRESFIIKSGLKLNSYNENLMEKLLTCIYQATENSSDDTFNAAKSVAEKIGATFMNFNVNSIMKDYIDLVEVGLKRKLTWETDDIALQNIQARVRIPGLWMIANINQSLLLCTSNRSESAVGYCTADGDLSGSISPIAGVSKEFLLYFIDFVYGREWYNFADADDDCKWVFCLDEIRCSKPTAELRPLKLNQNDEQDLMPYGVLDRIEKLAILDKKMPAEVLESLIMLGGYDDEQLKEWVNKFFRLWQRNQWKRDKMPPGFMLDDENLDPKSWCRFPLLSAKFEEV